MPARTILFIHQAFPGQFEHLARTLAAEGNRVYALALNPQKQVQGVKLMQYRPVREQLDEEHSRMLRELDAKLIRGESVYKALKELKRRGLNPDVVYAHPGWGEALFIKDIWPDARLVVYAEWYYNSEGQEVNFDPEMPELDEEGQLRLIAKNIPFLKALSDCDAAIAPTEWQKSRFPAWAQDKITVIHDGLNLMEMANVFPKSLRLNSRNLVLKRGMPIITYCAMHLEPVRGFHYFMRSLPAILNANKEAHVIVMGMDAGVDNVGYGAENPEGTTWRQTLEKELGDSVDWSRVHFLGHLDHKLYLAMLKLSACHVYLTTPFILSWSFLEAAALGIPIIASNTAPVREFDNLKGIEHVEFGDVDGLARKVLHRLSTPPEPFYDENIEIIRNLDISRTIPAIKDALIGTRGISPFGAPVEEIIIIED